MDKIEKLITKIVYEIVYLKYRYLKRKYVKTQENLLRTLGELTVMDSVMKSWH